MSLDLERALATTVGGPVSGLDEVGRGAWAGPVTVGLVVVDDAGKPAPAGLRDSKLLTPARRAALVPIVHQWASAWAVGHASAAEVDALGITAALRRAARRALAASGRAPNVIVLDGPVDYVGGRTSSDHHPVDADVVCQVGADRACASVAAASILAKVARDQLMEELATVHPAYRWDRNKGYGTAAHRAALEAHGPSPLHRRTWRIPGGDTVPPPEDELLDSGAAPCGARGMVRSRRVGPSTR